MTKHLKISLFLLPLIIHSSSQAQVALAPSVTDGYLPADSEAVCEIPFFPEISDELEGPFEGALINDFTLYDVEGTAYTASEILEDGKPMMLISSSYSCFVYRWQIDKINTIQSVFGDFINIYVVYTVEAHPTDPSPYFNAVNIGAANYAEEILISQPLTYGERKDIVATMQTTHPVNVPVLLDTPCNDWWLNFGTNPNCAFFINPDGTVYDAQEWFDRYPDKMSNTIFSYFGEEPPVEEDSIPNGVFYLVDYEEDCIQDDPGMTIITSVDLANTATADSYLEILRLSEDLPSGWASSICTDVCYPPDVEVANMYLYEGTASYFSYYFYTDEYPGEGEVELLVKNVYTPANFYTVTLKACTSDGSVTAIEDIDADRLIVAPNPASNAFQIFAGDGWQQNTMLEMYDLNGQRVMLQPNLNLNGGYANVNVDQLPAGMYMLRLSDEMHSTTECIQIL